MIPAPRPTPSFILARWRALAAWAAWALGTLLASWQSDAGVDSHSAGVLGEWGVWGWWGWWGVAVVFVLLAATFRNRVVPVCMFGALVAISGGWFTHQIVRAPPAALDVLVRGREAPILVTVEARVRTPVLPALPPEGELAAFFPAAPRVVFRASVDAVRSDDLAVPATGEISVWVAGDTPVSLTPGDTFRATGVFTPVGPALNPGQPDRLRWSRQSARVGSLQLTDASLIVPLATGDWSWDRLVWSARERALLVVDRMTAGASPQTRALIGALLLGQADPSLDDLSRVFAKLGVVHILSISGLHVAAMAGFAAVLIRLCGERGRWQTAALLLPIVLYLLLVPAQAPVIRAGVLGLTVILAELAGRRYDTPTLLIWTSLGILVWRPMDLWSMGYQLSCGMTLALLWLGSAAHDAIWGARVILPGAWRRWTWAGAALGAVKGSISVSILCWSLSTPTVWCRTGLLSFGAVAASVVLAPFFAVLLYVGFAALLLGMVFPPLAGIVAFLITAVSRMAVSVATAIESVPLASVWAPPLPWWAAAGMTCAVIFWWVSRRRVRETVAGAAIILGLAVAGPVVSTSVPGKAVRIDTFAVGDGTCHLIRSSPRDAMLWDAGSLKPGIGVRELPAAIRAVGAWRVPTAVISHGDLDHYAALPDLADAIGLERVLIVDRMLERARRSPTGPAAAVLKRLTNRGVRIETVRAGDRIRLGEVTLTILSPEPDAAYGAENDFSLVARIDRGAGPADGPALALLTGDVQQHAIARLRDRHPDLRARWVEAPHHGSDKPEAAAWVESLMPEAVVQSTGPRRAQRPGAWSDLRRWTLWRTTATDGALVTTINADGQVRCEPSPR